MKDRLTSLGLALGALALFWMLIFPKPGSQSKSVIRPLSTESGDSGYLGLWRWLSAEGVAVASLRDHYEGLSSPAVSPSASGNLLLTTLPHAVPVRAYEWAGLDAWIRRGNTLLIMAALDDTPRWELSTDGSTLVAQLRRLSGLEWSEIKEHPTSALSGPRDALNQVVAPKRVLMIPSGVHPMFDGVASVATITEFSATRWQVKSVTPAPVLELAKRADNGDGAVWLHTLGAGRVIVSTFASPFTNQQLDEADNARWLTNIIGSSLAGTGRVIFDDSHQGLADYYDPKAFFADRRLHATLWWIVLLWLVFAVGSQRLRPAPASVPALDDTAMLRVSARFFSNMIAPAAAGRRLIEHFFNRLRRRLDLREDGQPVWAWLEAQARLPRGDIEQLRQLYTLAQSNGRISLISLQFLLSRLDGNLK